MKENCLNKSSASRESNKSMVQTINDKQIGTLTKLRDTLLPKLMSGEVC